MPSPDGPFFERFSALLKRRNTPASAPFLDWSTVAIEAGLKVYRNNIRTSLSRALEAKFPVIHALVGADFFRTLALEYFYAHPPSSPLLSAYGDKLPEFLNSFGPADVLPYLPDMARLEIAWLRAYHAEDAAPLKAREVFSATKNGNIGALCLKLHPSLRLVSSPYSIGAIWRRHHESLNAEKINAAIGECVLVIRKNNQVIVETIPDDIFNALKALAGSAPLETALMGGCDPQNLFETMLRHDAIIGAAKP